MRGPGEEGAARCSVRRRRVCPSRWGKPGSSTRPRAGRPRRGRAKAPGNELRSAVGGAAALPVGAGGRTREGIHGSGSPPTPETEAPAVSPGRSLGWDRWAAVADNPWDELPREVLHRRRQPTRICRQRFGPARGARGGKRGEDAGVPDSAPPAAASGRAAARSAAETRTLRGETQRSCCFPKPNTLPTRPAPAASFGPGAAVCSLPSDQPGATLSARWKANVSSAPSRAWNILF